MIDPPETTRRPGLDPTDTGTTLLVSNPAAAHVETQSSHWAVVGTRPSRVVDDVDDDTAFATVVETVQGLPGEYSVVRLDSGNGASLRAFRGIASSYDLYYYPRGDGIVVGDHFRDVLSAVPVSERTVPETVAIDQLLFGARPTGTYLTAVDRLGHGERLEWVAGETPEKDLVDTPSAGGPATPTDAMRRLDRHFEDVLGAHRFDGPVVTMLSGGVDSSLLHTYRDGDATTFAAYDSPEFEQEVTYAHQASDLLGSDHETLLFDEGDYLEHLESAIVATGHPLLLPQAVLMDRTFAESPHATYVNGYLADAIFGVGAAALASLARYTGRTVEFLPDVTWEVEALAETVDGLRRPSSHPEGAALNFRIHSDPDHLATWVGQAAVDERRRERFQYTRNRIEVTDGTGYGPHMHLGHAIEFFHDVAPTIWRHAAHARGVAMKTPFGGREVLESALAVPAGDRYARFQVPQPHHPTRVVRYKYLLKDLLEERLPAYDTKKPKGHGLLPTDRYLESGPLADVFDRYPVPEFVPEEHHETVRTRTDNIGWYAANYAIWRDRVLRNDDLGLTGTTTVVRR